VSLSASNDAAGGVMNKVPSTAIQRNYIPGFVAERSEFRQKWSLTRIAV